MCGIAGILQPQASLSEDQLRQAVLAMAGALRHRGPDGQGEQLFPQDGLALAHRSLRMMDQGPAGDQPASSPGGRYCLSYNGEIYNFRELRGQLEQRQYRFQGDGDSEVLLAALDEWGWEESLQRLDGMFALSCWDRQQRRLLLARDRFGEKPLYYGWIGNQFVFASELRALRRHPEFRLSLNLGALALYLQHGWVPAPECIQQGMAKLEPGHWLALDAASGQLRQGRYWSLEASLNAPCPEPPRQQQQRLHQLLRRSIEARLRASVPIGLVLSGGVDSSLVACIAQSLSPQPLHSFTLGFEENEYDEAPYSRAIAQHLGCQHHEHRLSGAEAAARVPGLAAVYDEPFGDSCVLATHCLAQFARGWVKGVLSGDGSDELFFGYQRYLRILSAWHNQRLSRSTLRRLDRAQAQGEGRLEQIHLGATALGFADPNSLLLQPQGVREVYGQRPPALLEGSKLLSYWDLKDYLSGDILTIVDRGTMGAGLESRAPFLQRDLVEYALSLPSQLGNRKLLLRRILSEYLPSSLFERPKQGFCVPIGAWLAGPLRDWAGDLFSPARIRRQGLFRPEVVEQLWQEHLHTGRHGLKLWVLAIFQQWLDLPS